MAYTIVDIAFGVISAAGLFMWLHGDLLRLAVYAVEELQKKLNNESGPPQTEVTAKATAG